MSMYYLKNEPMYMYTSVVPDLTCSVAAPVLLSQDAQAQASTSRGGLLSRLPGCVLGLACGDCNRAGSGEALEWWASLGVGVLVCTQCAGSHRALGAHITQVRFLSPIPNVEARSLWPAPHHSSSKRFRMVY